MMLAFAALLLIAVSASAQQSSSSGVVQNYSLDANNFIDALLKVSAQFQFSLGVEWVKSADTLKPVRVTRSHATVAGVIQAVVSNYAGYEWRTEHGFVHVFQRDLMRDTRNPLNITIKTFELTNTIAWANLILFHRIQRVVRTPASSGIVASVLGSLDGPVFNFAAHNAPARSILNKFVMAGSRLPVQPQSEFGLPHSRRTRLSVERASLKLCRC